MSCTGSGNLASGVPSLPDSCRVSHLRAAARPSPRRVARGPDSGAVGLLLMGAYLLADGFTSTFQQRLFAGYSMSHYNQVLYVGLCSIALSSFGELAPARACARHGRASWRRRGACALQ